MKLVLASIPLASTLLASGTASAEPPANTVTVDPVMGALGFAGRNVGDFSVGYQRRLGSHHAVLVEQTTVHVHRDPFHLTLLGLGAGYRYHWRAASSPFVGALAGARLGFGRYGEMDLGARAVFATAHAGWRWQAPSGLTVVARIGAGVARYLLDDGAPAEAVEMRDERLAPLGLEVDGELGVGWTF